jgi:hypothetical protein
MRNGDIELFLKVEKVVNGAVGRAEATGTCALEDEEFEWVKRMVALHDE